MSVTAEFEVSGHDGLSARSTLYLAVGEALATARRAPRILNVKMFRMVDESIVGVEMEGKVSLGYGRYPKVGWGRIVGVVGGS